MKGGLYSSEQGNKLPHMVSDKGIPNPFQKDKGIANGCNRWECKMP
jgi:hypothetical protein